MHGILGIFPLIWMIFWGNVGKYSSTMEYLALCDTGSVSNAWAWLRSKEVKVSTSISKIDVTWHCGYFCWWIYANLTSKRWGSLNIYVCHVFFCSSCLYCHLFCHVWCHFVVVFSSGAGSRIRSRLASTRVIFLYFVFFWGVIFAPLFFFYPQIGTHFLRFVLHFPSQTWQWNDNTNPKWQTWMKKMTNKWQHIYFCYIFHCLQAQYFPNVECMAQDNPAK